MNYLKDIAKQYKVEKIANVVLDDEKFYIWSGSSNKDKHHYGYGQLAIHTEEVVRLCLANNFLMDYKIDDRLLFLAALFHDYGKIWDYQPSIMMGFEVDKKSEWSNADHKTKIHHISRSVIEWTKASEGILLESEIDQVTHAILAHHQLREWGSPVQPKTKIAWILHFCDGISARMNELKTQL